MYLLLAVLALPLLYFSLRWFFHPILHNASLPLFPSSAADKAKPEQINYPYESPSDKKNGQPIVLPKLVSSSSSSPSSSPLSVSLSPASLSLSLIVPAYNEQERLPIMMEQTMKYLTARSKADSSFTYEILIVDDGSRDSTSSVARDLIERYGADRLRLVRLPVNQGKGGAVQQGIMHSRGELLLMVDADGATDINDFSLLESSLPSRTRPAVAIGSRAHFAENAAAERAWYRNILMYGFHFLVSFLCVSGIKDTQCGFKLFTRPAAAALFMNQHLKRWSFDVELLYLAQTLGIPIKEVPVNWHEVAGSKLAIIESSIHMGRDLLVIRLAYMSGMWKIVPATEKLLKQYGK